MRSKFSILKDHACNVPALNSKQESAMDGWLLQFMRWFVWKRVECEDNGLWRIGKSYYDDITLLEQYINDVNNDSIKGTYLVNNGHAPETKRAS